MLWLQANDESFRTIGQFANFHIRTNFFTWTIFEAQKLENDFSPGSYQWCERFNSTLVKLYFRLVY